MRSELTREPPRLSELEWEVMKPLWKHGPLAARDIYGQVPDAYGWAYETVKTMLARLVRKGALAYDRVGNSFLYRPVFTRGEMARAAMRSFLQRVFDGGGALFAAQFVEEASEDELAAMKAELKQTEVRTNPKPTGRS